MKSLESFITEAVRRVGDGPYYEITEETMKFGGRTLYRIRNIVEREIAVIDEDGERDIITLMPGQLGGWVEGQHNMPADEPNCWIGEDAKVWGDSLVYMGGSVMGRAEIENGRVFAGACVSGDVKVTGKRGAKGVLIGGEARVFGGAQLRDRADIAGYAVICGRAVVEGTAHVIGQVLIDGDAKVGGRARVGGMRTRDDRDHDWGTHIGGDAEVIGKARIMRGEYLSGTYAEEQK